MDTNAKLYSNNQIIEFVLTAGKQYPEHAIFDSWDKNNYTDRINGVTYSGAKYGLSYHTDCLSSSLGTNTLTTYLRYATITDPELWFYDSKNSYYLKRSFPSVWTVVTNSIDIINPGIIRISTRLEFDSLDTYRNKTEAN